MSKQNPLLTHDALPEFDQIKPEHALPAIEAIISENEKQLAELLEKPEITWDDLIPTLETMENMLSRAWSPVSHLHAVMNTQGWREAYQACLPKLTEYYTALGQNKKLYEAFVSLKESDAFKDYSDVRKKIIEDELRDFQLSGVALDDDKKKQFAQLQLKLSKLTNQFEVNILDATQAWCFHTEDLSELAGLPDDAIKTAENVAKQKNLEGYVLTLEQPCFITVMFYADNRNLRKTFYEAYTTRASEVGPNAGEHDNSPVMIDILNTRHALANLVNYDNYAHYSLATKMLKSPEQVIDFLHDLVKRSKHFAKRDMEELKAFAEKHVDHLQSWDIAYYSEKLKQEKYHINDELLRPYFPVDKVFYGMFKVIEHLYNVTVKEIKGVPVWHESVRFFEILDANGEVKGKFYADLFARQNKRSGAWMDDYCGRFEHMLHGMQIPIAYLNCNFNAPVGDQPALLKFDEVLTLFHEFGHGLHHMLTEINYLSISGISGVAWDAVELPSQFMENFCWQEDILPYISEHYKTKEPLPHKMFENLLKAKNFQSGMQMVRQLEFALFDFTLHNAPPPSSAKEIQKLLNTIRQEVAVVEPPEYNRFQHSFSHIFAGGYAAGYYSYKWAEVLSSDAFARFEEEGVLNPETGQAFLNEILSQGGSKEPMELFIAFRGREPSIDALLRHSGLE